MEMQHQKVDEVGETKHLVFEWRMWDAVLGILDVISVTDLENFTVVTKMSYLCHIPKVVDKVDIFIHCF